MTVPEWFKVGVTVWFEGMGMATEVVSINDRVIDDEDASWTGRDLDGDHLIPLDEVSRYWFNHRVDWMKKK